ncbi:MAG: hypothetical protein SwBeaMacB_13910 [Shewanella algae]|nr:hypothetical protein TUM4442_20630 [Shewanella algae]BCV58153.1 hypothetical protein TUM17384_20980 [Shewanella algae]
MKDLKYGWRTTALSGLSQASQTRDEAIIMCCKLIGKAYAVCHDMCTPSDDHAYAIGSMTVVGEFLIRNCTIGVS